MRKSITIVGLGAGDLNQLTIGVYETLKQTNNLFLRTKEHPVIPALEKDHIHYESFDEIYEQYDQFTEVYEAIVQRLFQEVKQRGNLVYAVPGHPLVAEKTVQLLLEQADKQEVEVKINGGQSFLDAIFTAVQVDPIEGFQLLDGTALHRDDLQLNQHLIIGQVYDAFVASEIKLTLMEKYPDNYPLKLITAAGTSKQKVESLLLYELDRGMALDNLTSVYVPPVKEAELQYQEFSTLRRIISTLRGPDGCPWDKKQTHQSLKKYLIEEAYELLAAIEAEDIDNTIEELGDVLLQVLLHAQIGEDDGLFSIDDVITGLSAKMIRRHPHVFGKTKAENVEEAFNHWEKAKEREQGEQCTASILDKIAKGLPALLHAYELQKQAAKVGFDWEEAKDALKKVWEEMQEFEEALENGNREEQLKECGDLLFSVINAARLLSIHPEEALLMTNQKFKKRFSFIEKKVQESGRTWDEYPLSELDQLWEAAKTQE
ncbi:bifunctional methyltransferase/pyrophosphohydrolase YabN [Bacillus chungangensis]|uniref:Tetrapyrrole methylase family protein/MazG family protein n=1 Tax=Bacillus chungangensis TaxID=587633 RepID=A0ABT9WXD9_9BACI|nr:nucleoside triphosphate pyrophosphohydrolase [Bacillus chungangensis]MDQ0177897.1 tetrapyrrole methylase family protein/MazG family protein [Bacillus chungangensis]